MMDKQKEYIHTLLRPSLGELSNAKGEGCGIGPWLTSPAQATHGANFESFLELPVLRLEDESLVRAQDPLLRADNLRGRPADKYEWFKNTTHPM